MFLKCTHVMLKVDSDSQTDTDRDGLMKTKLCKSSTCTRFPYVSFPYVETIKVEVNVVHKRYLRLCY